MTIEEEVKQEKFESEFQKAAVNILFTGSWLYNINASFLSIFIEQAEEFNKIVLKVFNRK